MQIWLQWWCGAAAVMDDARCCCHGRGAVRDGTAPDSGEIGVKVAGMEQVQARWFVPGLGGDWNPDSGRKRRRLPWRLMVAVRV